MNDTRIMEATYYDEDYFSLQNEIGLLSAKAMRHMFAPYIPNDAKLLDFGSGGGYFLNVLQAREKIGVEINPTARANASKLGIQSVASCKDVADNWADVVMTSHALEHCHDPLGVLRDLYQKLRPGGRLIALVPHERKMPYRPKDVNQHLFTWSEMNIANLIATAGYEVEKAEEIKHRFPPFSSYLMKVLGERGFHLLASIYGRIDRRVTQIRVTAIRPKA